MSVDTQDYTGALDTPAAVEQQSINSYMGNEHEFPVLPPETAEVAATSEANAPVQESAPVQEDPQALNFKALSDSVERLKAEREQEKREYQLQLDMLRANLSKERQPNDSPKVNKMFDGMEDSDVPNVGELRKAWTERESAYNERIEELQVANQYSDYAEVLTKYGKKLAETDPVFVQGIRGADNKALFAYQYAKKEARLQELEGQMRTKETPTPSQKVQDAQKIVANARKPGTLSQAGGQSVLSQANYYETMSDEDFMNFASKNLNKI